MFQPFLRQQVPRVLTYAGMANACAIIFSSECSQKFSSFEARRDSTFREFDVIFSPEYFGHYSPTALITPVVVDDRGVLIET